MENFIDVESANELEDKDRVTVVLCTPSAEPPQAKARICFYGTIIYPGIILAFFTSILST